MSIILKCTWQNENIRFNMPIIFKLVPINETRT